MSWSGKGKTPELDKPGDQTSGRGGHRTLLLAGGAAIVLFLAAYSNFYRNAFHFDDSHVLVTNLNLRTLKNLPRFFTDASTFSNLPANASYRPLCALSLAIDYAIAGGLDPVVFHASQLAQMLLLGVALFFLYRRVMDTAGPGDWNGHLAVAGAAFFALHTINTEAMNLMHARSELLSALGVVGAFLIYLRGGRARQLGLHNLAMIAGALAKPPAVIFGPLLFLWVGLESRWCDPATRSSKQPWRAAALRALRVALPSILIGAATFLLIGRMDGPQASYGGGDRYHYALTQAWAWLHYLRLFVLPTGLTADTDLRLITDWQDPRVQAGLLAIAALAAAAWRAAISERAWPIAFGIGWLALGLAPASSILPLAEPINEHRPFLGFIGLVLATVWAARLGGERALARLARTAKVRRSITVGVVGLVLVAHAVGTYERNRVWRNDSSLWSDVTRKSPGNGRGWMNYGLTFMRRGAYGEARRCFDRAQAILPSYYFLEINQGILEGALENQEEAERRFRRAVSLAPTMPDPHFYYGRWLAERSRGPEALAELEQATRLTPGFAPALDLELDLQAARGNWQATREIAAASLANDPREPRAADFAQGRIPLEDGEGSYEALFRKGMRSIERKKDLEAALAFRAALGFEPESADALNNLGFVLARMGFFSDAIAPLEQALEKRPDFALARNNLAWARSELAASPQSGGGG